MQGDELSSASIWCAMLCVSQWETYPFWIEIEEEWMGRGIDGQGEGMEGEEGEKNGWYVKKK